MSWIQTRRRAQEAPAGRPMEDTLRRQMAWAAGTEQFQHRDPLYHVTESFQQTFDAIGRRHAQELAGGRTEEGADQTSGENQMPDQTSARSFYERSRPEDQDMVRRFSETAFQRGTLSGAVLEGTGQMMLFSCLKKTVGQSQPDKWQQRKLFEKASPMRNVPGHSPDKVVFNRGFTNSAVGLVVDTLRDARRTVEDMQDLALGRSEMGQDGADTLRTMYPLFGRQTGAGAAGAVPATAAGGGRRPGEGRPPERGRPDGGPDCKKGPDEAGVYQQAALPVRPGDRSPGRLYGARLCRSPGPGPAGGGGGGGAAPGGRRRRGRWSSRARRNRYTYRAPRPEGGGEPPDSGAGAAE